MPKMWSDRLEKMFGPGARAEGTADAATTTSRRARSRRFEEIYMEIVRHAVEDRLPRPGALGRVRANGVANRRVVMEGLADRVYIHPAAGDDGTGAGAACYVLYSKLGVTRRTGGLAGVLGHGLQRRGDRGGGEGQRDAVQAAVA